MTDPHTAEYWIRRTDFGLPAPVRYELLTLAPGHTDTEIQASGFTEEPTAFDVNVLGPYRDREQATGIIAQMAQVLTDLHRRFEVAGVEAEVQPAPPPPNPARRPSIPKPASPPTQEKKQQ